jgi:hypothetical protein
MSPKRWSAFPVQGVVARLREVPDTAVAQYTGLRLNSKNRRSDLKILFIHQNFPGQFRYLAPALAKDPANTVVAIADGRNQSADRVFHGIRLETYSLDGEAAQGIHPSLQGLHQATRRGQEAARACIRLRNSGFYPDLIIGHGAWGDNLFIKDVFPNSKLVNYCEYFFNPQGREHNFDPEYPSTLDVHLKGRTANITMLSSLDSCDYGISPTNWQRAMHPVE